MQRVAYSSSYVYIYTTGLASYTMGNWLTPNGQTYQSWPANRAAIHRIPRITNPASPTVPSTKLLMASHGNGGVLVNGVLVWENGDAQSYKNAATSGSNSTASSADISQSGDGVWNRLAGVAEAFNFDTANAHQPTSGAYHNHINPKALRFQLGDNVTYDSSTKLYSEGGTPTAHSPIIGWANDGLPIYGPYGYSTATDTTSGIRRMTSGFVKRNAANAALYPGMDDLAVTGRVKLPVWAASVQGISQTLPSSKYGPTTTATYALGPTTKTCTVGTFAEDYEYLGDFGKVQGTDFDLNRQNVRFCKTPEYPGGTYAYFVCVDASGNSVFPDIFNQEYFLTPAPGSGTVSSISEAVTEYADAGPAAAITVSGSAASGGNVQLSWNSAEGATYKVEASDDSATYTTLSSTVTSGGLTTSYTTTTGAANNYYRVTLTAIATYDTGGTYGTPVGTTKTYLYGTAATAASITTQPASQTVTAGTSVTFSVVASGTGTLSYQWKKAGTAISGATSATYTIVSPTNADAGSYTVVVTNVVGSTTSNVATLAVNAANVAPSITTQPASQTVSAGASVTFTVAASGTAPLSYQWAKGGIAIGGATNASLTVASAQFSDAGNYSVSVVNALGNVTSNVATLTVNTTPTAPSITTAPSNQTVTAGASASFTVVASGTPPLSYQWNKNGAAIAGATSATYSIASTAAGDAGSYTVTVTNSAASVTSGAVTLTVNPVATSPSITTQPAGASVTSGSAASFTVVASGTAPLTYQWSKNGSAIGGATSATYSIASAQTADAGNYTVTITNSAGSATSGAAALTVTASATAPTITTQPASLTVSTGTSANFSVVASGTAPLSYQWSKNGSTISGATSATYAIASAAAADAGSYTVAITNSVSSITSSAATLTVSNSAVAPTITTQPAGTSVNAGNTATFSVVANGTAPLTYQWTKNGSAISGATSATYSVAGAQSADAGSYAVVVTNSAGSVTSTVAALTVSTVAVAPSIATQPASVVANLGDNVTFTVVASGTAPFTYQWSKGGVAITGATASSYALTSVQSGNAGNYSVVVTNSVGSVTSSVAALTLATPATAPTILQQPASTTVSVLSTATFVVVASGTPAPTYQWRKNGTAISGATSATLTVSNATAIDAGTYTCVVTNDSGSVTSTGAALTVSVAPVGPSIASQPQAATATVGTSVTFGVIANGTAPLVYQWLKGTAVVPGATGASYTIASVQASDAGSYTCVVGNDYGSVVSNAAVFTFDATILAPTITTQPANQTVNLGAGASFNVVASSTAPLTYQWSKNGSAIAGATSANYSIASAQAADAGSYTVTATNSGGSATSNAATLTVNVPATAPSIATQPAGATLTVGGSATFSVSASGTAPFAYQWLKNSAAISGATGTSYSIPNAQLTDAGNYTVTVTNSAGVATSNSATLVVNAPPPVAPTLAAGIVNLAVRTRIGGVAGTPITGFVLRGAGAGKRLIVRAVGPTLVASFGLAAGLGDPRLDLLSGSTIVASNDNWNLADADAMSAAGAFPLNVGSGDAAIVTTLRPGTYTSLVAGPAGSSGIVLIECYDAATADITTRLVNASARAYVGTGDDVLIPGFTIAGEGTVKVLVRAVGPGLAAFGVPGTLADPQITLFSGSAVVASNDDWGDATNASQIPSVSAQNGAFALPAGSKDSVLLVSLSAGSYSAVVSGVGGRTSTVIFELYVVP